MVYAERKVGGMGLSNGKASCGVHWTLKGREVWVDGAGASGGEQPERRKASRF